MAAADAQVFEIADFTAISPWERFVSRIEEVLRAWGLGDGGTGQRHEPFSDDSDDLSTTIDLEGTPYLLVYHYDHSAAAAPGCQAMTQWMDPTLDFAAGTHRIRRMFGVLEFLLLAPAHDTPLDFSRASMLLSSLTLAVDYAHCKAPHFVPVNGKARGSFIGYVADADTGVFARMEADVTRKVPASFRYMSGLLDMFHSKLGVVDRHALDERDMMTSVSMPIRSFVTVRFSFARGSDWYEWRKDRTARKAEEVARVPKMFRSRLMPRTTDSPTTTTSTADNSDDENDDFANVNSAGSGASIQWGPGMDPIESIELTTTWPHVVEDALVDNASYSALDPHQAPVWALRVTRTPSVECALSMNVRALVEAWAESGAVNSFDALLRQAPLVKAVTSAITSSSRVPSAQEIDLVMRSLFPTEAPPSESQMPSAPDQLLPHLKAAPPNSLFSRFVLLGGLRGGLRTLAPLWAEFVRELRWHWGHDVDLPRVATQPHPIDVQACLVHQKLQMIQCCMKSRRIFESHGRTATPPRKPRPTTDSPAVASAHDSAGSDLEGDQEGDEFYDTVEGFEEVSAQDTATGGGSGVGAGGEAFTVVTGGAETPAAEEAAEAHRVSEGGLKQLENQTLLASGKPLMIPITQEQGFLTEDMIDEQQAVFSNLGTSAEAAAIRAKMQSTSLLSDMQAFKAANPESVLPDFVRWHSPRDWVPNTQQASSRSLFSAEDDAALALDPNSRFAHIGRLSARMQKADNLWAQLWQKAKPIPVSRQEPLFNYNLEAEKALNFLETILPEALLEQMVPVALVGTVHELARIDAATLPCVTPALRALSARIQDAVQPGVRAEQVLELVAPLEQLESDIATAASLLIKLPGGERLVSAVTGKGEAAVEGEAEQRLVTAMFETSLTQSTAGRLPPPSLREYIFRRSVSRPVPDRTVTGSRLYAALTDDDMRIATVFAMADI